MKDEVINEEVDKLIDLVAERLKRGVSTERLLNNGETRQLCKAVVQLREDNVAILRNVLGLDKKEEDETLKL
tara:strand:- start:17809 stop:18024 length:216 start_codon:yes stop_codon:yes gene_type:complete